MDSSPLQVDQPNVIRQGEELDLAKLEAYLLENMVDCRPPLSIKQFRSGYSNLTYMLELTTELGAAKQFVLRRPPFGNQVKTAHDMSREFRVLSALAPKFHLAPKPYLFCDDHSIIGDQFYVMQRCEGVILRGGKAAGTLRSDPQQVRALCDSMVEVLAALHRLDYHAIGLADLGNQEGYVDRQIDGWIRRYEKAKTDEWDGVRNLSKWLSEHREPTGFSGLIHNDFKHDNLILDPHDLSRIVAVLDWEMSTIGDPLMDIGSSLAYWIEANDPPELQQIAFGPTAIPGSMTRQELFDLYLQKSGFECANPVFYFAYGLFKLATIVQQIYARYVKGHTKDERFENLDQIVLLLGVLGERAIQQNRISF